MVNQRKNPRKNCRVLVDVKSGAPFDGSRTVDISEGGAGFVSDRYIPVNTRMMVQIDLNPDEDPVLALGVVQWINKIGDGSRYRVGLKFIEIIHGAKSKIRRCKVFV